MAFNLGPGRWLEILSQPADVFPLRRNRPPPLFSMAAKTYPSGGMKLTFAPF
jgi:hypothetical protein